MRKFVLFFIVILTLEFNGNAQEINYSLYSGYSLNSLQSNTIGTKSKEGFLVGFGIEKPICQSTKLSLGAQFSNSGFQEPQQHSNGSELGIVTYNQYNMYYMQLPLLVRNLVRLTDKVDFYPIYGVSNSWLLKAKKLSEDPSSSTLTEETLSGKNYYRYELSIQGGLGIDWKLKSPISLFFQIRGNQGVSNWYGKQFVSGSSGAYNRNVGFQLISGIRF